MTIIIIGKDPIVDLAVYFPFCVEICPVDADHCLVQFLEKPEYMYQRIHFLINHSTNIIKKNPWKSKQSKNPEEKSEEGRNSDYDGEHPIFAKSSSGIRISSCSAASADCIFCKKRGWTNQLKK